MNYQWQDDRERMISLDLRARGIRDERLLEAFRTVPRHAFVPYEHRLNAYADSALSLAGGQTISQPYIVALMTEALGALDGAHVLEIGTGSGYQTAILAELGACVWTVERDAELQRAAETRLLELGYRGVEYRCADGTMGWPDAAPFDGVLATGSLPEVPSPLLDQLRPGGFFVGPVGRRAIQELIRIVYHPQQMTVETLCRCRFVPLIGRNGWTH